MTEKDLTYGIQVNSTLAQIKEFKSSVLWADIKREFEFWIKGFDEELNSITDNAAVNNPSTASVLIHIGDINGRKKAVQYMLDILDVFEGAIRDSKNLNPMEDEDEL